MGNVSMAMTLVSIALLIKMTDLNWTATATVVSSVMMVRMTNVGLR